MSPRVTYVVAPTFREAQQAKALLGGDFERAKYLHTREQFQGLTGETILVVSNPGHIQRDLIEEVEKLHRMLVPIITIYQ